VLGEEEVASATPCALAWRRDPEEPDHPVALSGERPPLDEILRAWELEGPLQWRAV
jgi:hypothetical protein